MLILKCNFINKRKGVTFLLPVIILFYMLLCSCGNGLHPHSFCWWQRTFELDKTDLSLLQATGSNHLYIRYFDVDWDVASNQPLPAGTLIATATPPCHFTPTIFITNNVFVHASHLQIDSLAIRIYKRVDAINRHFIASSLNNSTLGKSTAQKLECQWSDLLIDCDWTQQTKENYFYFLQKMAAQFSNKELSVTLRLWQYKHLDLSGIPPVNRCLLMCYNLADPKNIRTDNSIGSVKELKSYLIKSNYPLHLDIALPIFSWGVVFHSGQWAGLLDNTSSITFTNDTLHFQAIKSNCFMLKKDTVIGQRYLRYGDEVRVEEIGAKELEEMVLLIKKQVPLRDKSRLTLFSFDPSYVNKYEIEEICHIYALFDR
jgi:hypothetical protein